MFLIFLVSLLHYLRENNGSAVKMKNFGNLCSRKLHLISFQILSPSTRMVATRGELYFHASVTVWGFKQPDHGALFFLSHQAQHRKSILSHGEKGITGPQSLRANKLACYCFTDAGRRHKTLGSETKDVITHSMASNLGGSTFASDPLTPGPM